MVIFLDILYFWFGFWGEFLGIVGLGLVLTWVFGLLQLGGFLSLEVIVSAYEIDSVCEVDELGNKFWYVGGVLHRVDGPAIEWVNGDKEWFLGGKCHREGGPAVECTDGYGAWYVGDELHRVDGPAIEWADGGREWYVNGLRHKIDGPAVEYASGNRAWFLNGNRFDGVGFLLDVFVGVVECGGGWLPGVVVVDGFEFWR